MTHIKVGDLFFDPSVAMSYYRNEIIWIFV